MQIDNKISKIFNKIMEILFEFTSNVFFIFKPDRIIIYSFDIFNIYKSNIEIFIETNTTGKTFFINNFNINQENYKLNILQDDKLYQDNRCIGFLVQPQNFCDKKFQEKFKMLLNTNEFCHFCDIITELSICGGLLNFKKTNDKLILETTFELGNVKFSKLVDHRQEDFSVLTVIKYYKILISFCKLFKNTEIIVHNECIQYNCVSPNFTIEFIANHYTENQDQLFNGE